MRCRVHVLPAPRSRVLHGGVRAPLQRAVLPPRGCWCVGQSSRVGHGELRLLFALLFLPVFRRPGFPLCAVTVLGRRSSCDLARKVFTSGHCVGLCCIEMYVKLCHQGCSTHQYFILINLLKLRDY